MPLKGNQGREPGAVLEETMHKMNCENMVHSLVELSASGTISAAVLFGRYESRQQLGLNPAYLA